MDNLEKLIYESIIVSSLCYDKKPYIVYPNIKNYINKKSSHQYTDEEILTCIDNSSYFNRNGYCTFLSNPVYFKFRTFGNKKFLREIICYNKLYASQYKDLNDPMEGVYYNYGLERDEHKIEALFSDKNLFRICSLSYYLHNYLLWSYYADGHKGIVFVVEKDKDTNLNIDFCPVEYSAFNIFDGDFLRYESAKKILSHKITWWEHEREIRAFLYNNGRRDEQHIPIKVKAIVLGSRITDKHKKFINNQVKYNNPEIIIIDNFRCSTMPVRKIDHCEINT